MVADICIGNCSSEVGSNGWTIFEDELYFSADDGEGVELWAYSEELRMVSNFGESIDPGIGLVFGLINFEDRIWFDADDGQNGREVWYSDGTNIYFWGSFKCGKSDVLLLFLLTKSSLEADS